MMSFLLLRLVEKPVIGFMMSFLLRSFSEKARHRLYDELFASLV
ncbi:hypothetical protein ACFVAD_21305 [Sutcliffiella sp. NPDC057660]